MKFTYSEKFVLVLIALLLVANALLISIKQPKIDWLGYGIGISTALGMLALAQFYRTVRKGNNERIALAITAAGLFILFTIAGSVFNYLLLPLSNQPIDRTLVEIDARYFGYNWQRWVIFIADYPTANTIMRTVYISSLPQLIIAVIYLGFTNQPRRLDIFMIASTTSALFAILIWSMFPSAGPAGYWDVPADIEAQAGIIVNTAYGAELYRIFAEGVTLISPKDALGLIGFPSYHTVMAILSCYAFFHSKWLRLPILLINLTMVPAILIHGGHNLSDMLAGLVLAIFCLSVTRVYLNSMRPTHSTQAVK
ncbi:MAG: phosphatase PAP2 family protein [Ahrensia sp.]|nr:phosphatase PAP2 family protein [Ahrensia sp.]